MKKFLLINVFILLLIFSSISYSEDKINIFYNSEEINFASEPKIVENVLMVPMRQFFESFDTNVTWISETQEILAYKDNTFIKLKIDDPICHINGKKTILSSPPVLIDGRTLVPIEFVAKTFDMELSWNDNKTILNIKNKYRDNIYSYLGETFFKKYYVKNEEIEFSLPNSWEKISKNEYSYSLLDGIKNYKLNISSEFLNNLSLNDYIKNIKTKLQKNNPDEVTFSELVDLEINDILFKIISINHPTVEDDLNRKNVLYFFKYDQKVYLFNFTYYGMIQDDDAINLINQIMNSLKISKLTINQNDEHYIEFKKFFDLGMNIESELYANKSINNSFVFSGSINSDKFATLRIIVEKGNNKRSFIVPIKDKKFNKKIYTPFGLGKHNITVSLNENEISEYNNQSIITMNKPNSSILMQFSVINLENENILYLLPNDKVQANNEELASAAKLITIDYNNSFDKAKALYEWLFDNIELKESYSSDDEDNTDKTIEYSTSLEVFNSSKGSNLEINFLYNAFLRSINIPSRIIKRESNEGEIFYQTEIYINGRWIITDINSEITSFENENYSNFNYFNIYDQNYFKKFEVPDESDSVEYMEILDY